MDICLGTKNGVKKRRHFITEFADASGQGNANGNREEKLHRLIKFIIGLRLRCGRKSVSEFEIAVSITE